MKTDRRDAEKLVRALRMNDLAFVHVPDEHDEAFRDLVRCWFSAKGDLIAETGALSRFDNPRQLMAWLGLVPSEYSSGAHIRKGGITKSGNGYARRLLVEAAWSYRYAPKVSRIIEKRHEGLPKEIIDRAWDAQLRLCKRFKKLSARGKHHNVIVVSVARELAGFIWDIARRVPIIDQGGRHIS